MGIKIGRGSAVRAGLGMDIGCSLGSQDGGEAVSFKGSGVPSSWHQKSRRRIQQEWSVRCPEVAGPGWPVEAWASVILGAVGTESGWNPLSLHCFTIRILRLSAKVSIGGKGCFAVERAQVRQLPALPATAV